MPKLPLVLALLTMALPLGPAVAQSGQAPAAAPDANAQNVVPQTALRLSKLVGVSVIGLDHNRIGEIEEVLVDRDGKAQAVVIGVGGFLGIGEKSVAVPFDTVLWNTGDVSDVTSPSASLKPSEAPPPRASGDLVFG